jgi:hypothetical protein
LLAKPTQLNINLSSDRFAMFNKQRDITGNLCDSNSEKVIGHVSLDGTFVGASWLSDELFGKPSGEADADRSRARTHRARHRPKQASVQRPNNLPPRTAVSKEPEKPLAHSQPSSGDPQAGLNTSEKVSDHMQSCLQ